MDWRQYQEQTAEFFRSLGCDADVDVRLVGARAEHKIDVWVRFKKFGLETKWVIECKFWNTAVTKEKVLVLRSVVEEIGADRGILISANGFQSGAVRATEKTNITLTDFEGLKESAQEDLVSSLLHNIETRAVELKYALFNLYSREQTSPHSWTSTPRPGVDGEAVMRTVGKLALLECGFDQVRLKNPPYPVNFDDAGQHTVVVETLNEFVDRASEVINEAESVLKANSGGVTVG